MNRQLNDIIYADSLYAAALVTYNKEEMFSLLETAAMSDHLESMYELGNCYYFGEGVNKDIDAALQWFLRAATFGHPAASHHIATMYRFGSGVAVDLSKAAFWYMAAADAGYMLAKQELEKLPEEITGIKHKEVIFN